MSHNNCILDLLNLKDKHIIFDDFFEKEEVIGKQKAKVFLAKLTYIPEACPNCGCTHTPSLIKYGFKTSMIKLPAVSLFATYLRLRKQKYHCKHCHSFFLLSTSVVNKHCFISHNTKQAVALSAQHKISETDIAKLHQVSHHTVNRIINSGYEDYQIQVNYLPPHLCFDEFKSTKSCKGAMSFVFCDSKTHQIIDIVEDRRLPQLITYFLRYTKAARNSVKTVVIDMYAPYMQLIQSVFPNAHIIIDRFHLVQLLTRALNKTRVRVMNAQKKEHSKFKKYWKLLLKNESDLQIVTSFYRPHYKRFMREIDIVADLLSKSPELKASYQLYQSIRYCIQHNQYDHFMTALSETIFISDEMKTSVKTLKKYASYIKNTMDFPTFNNGVIEGINNYIKCIKRIAFGYRSFFHLRNRILISRQLTTLKKL